MHQMKINPSDYHKMKSPLGGTTMKMKTNQLATLAFLLLSLNLHAQHGHLNAGAAGTNQNDQLYFVNGAIFASSSGYVKALTYTNSGRFAGYYEGNITFTSLASSTNNGGPAFGHAAPGSFLKAEIVSVNGSGTGQFGFWESSSLSPVFSAPTGFSGGSYRFDLSDSALGAGLAGADPYGHIHGRRFTATAPGTYEVGFRIYDTSVNGAGGGPIHAPSDLFQLTFNAVAVPEPSTLALWGGSAAALSMLWWRQRGKIKTSRAQNIRGSLS